MTLTTDFPGTSLPAGWTFVNNSIGTATLSVADGFATVTNPAGTTVDSIASVGGAENTSGLLHSLSGDFDIAVRVASIVSGQDSSMFGFILRGASDAEMVRWHLYGNTTRLNKYGYARSGGTGNNFQGGVQTATYKLGQAAWIRAKRVGSVYWFYTSADGALWTQESTVTIGVDALTVKLSLGQYSSNLGTPFRWDAVVDLAAKGTTDARGPEPAYAAGASQTTTFDSLPAWLTTVSGWDGSATVSGGQLLLSTGPADGSHGRAEYVGTGHTDAGILVRVSFPTQDGNAYGVVGLGVQDGGPNLDQYSSGPGFIQEIRAGSGIPALPIRVHRPLTNNLFDEPYTWLQGAGTDTGATAWWHRIEKYGSRIRMRAWADGQVEPSTWRFDGEDRVLDGLGPLVPYLSISHNDGAAATATMAVDSLEFYQLEEPSNEFIVDSFTDVDLTPLEQHSPDKGGNWEVLPFTTSEVPPGDADPADPEGPYFAALVYENRLLTRNDGKRTPTYRQTANPGSDEYDITVTWTFGTSDSSFHWLCWRMTPTGTADDAVDRYMLIGDILAHRFELWRTVGGTPTGRVLLDTYSSDLASTVHNIRVEVRNDGMAIYSGETLMIQSSDTTITQRGRIGLGMAAGGTNHYIDDLSAVSVGYRYDLRYRKVVV